jgi:hypothetical protein
MSHNDRTGWGFRFDKDGTNQLGNDWANKWVLNLRFRKTLVEADHVPLLWRGAYWLKELKWLKRVPLIASVSFA